MESRGNRTCGLSQTRSDQPETPSQMIQKESRRILEILIHSFYFFRFSFLSQVSSTISICKNPRDHGELRVYLLEGVPEVIEIRADYD